MTTAAAIGCSEIRDIIFKTGIRVTPKLEAQIRGVICSVQIVPTKLEVVIAVCPGDRVGKLLATLVWEAPPIEERRRPEIETALKAEVYVRRYADSRTQQARLLIGIGWLWMLELKVAPVLITRFVGERVGNKGVEFRDSPSVLHVVISEAAVCEADAGLGLNARRRVPAHAISFKGCVVPLADVPVDLGQEDGLLAQPRHRSQFANKIVLSVGVEGLCLCCGDSQIAR